MTLLTSGSVRNRACERSGASRFAAPSLKPFLLHPAPRSAPRSGHFSKAAHRSAPTNFLAAPTHSDANASIMTELTTDVKFPEILSS